MLADNYNKKFYFSEEINENLPIAYCHICKSEILRGYNFYKIEDFLFDQSSCVSIYILSLASEQDYKKFSLADIPQFEEWYRAEKGINVYRLKV